MARNTIVAVILGVFTVILIIMAILDYIEGDVFATALTGITSVATVIIGITSKDNNPTTDPNHWSAAGFLTIVPRMVTATKTFL